MDHQVGAQRQRPLQHRASRSSCPPPAGRRPCAIAASAAMSHTSVSGLVGVRRTAAACSAASHAAIRRRRSARRRWSRRRTRELAAEQPQMVEPNTLTRAHHVVAALQQAHPSSRMAPCRWPWRCRRLGPPARRAGARTSSPSGCRSARVDEASSSLAKRAADGRHRAARSCWSGTAPRCFSPCAGWAGRCAPPACRGARRRAELDGDSLGSSHQRDSGVLQRQARALVAPLRVALAATLGAGCRSKSAGRDVAGDVDAVEARGLEAVSFGLSAATTLHRRHVLVDQRVGADELADLLGRCGAGARSARPRSACRCRRRWEAHRRRRRAM